ncbi:hypothetical protein WSM22_03550 [Cytophagales bacterium WSM2-2]|nr:hypothetical protein WSM22_03550 [Cytophagales bacterium WSM2-2]
MTALSAATTTEVVYSIEQAIKAGHKVAHQLYKAFTSEQLAKCIDHFVEKGFTRAKESLHTDRSMSKSLACFLYELNEQGKAEHYSVIRSITEAKYEHMVNDYSTLKYWRLIEPASNGRGFWKITERGKAFLEGKLRIAEKVTIKNDKVVGSSDKKVTIADFEGFKYVPYNPVADEDIDVTI